MFTKKDMTVSLFSVYFIELFAKDKSIFYLEIALLTLENTAAIFIMGFKVIK